MIAKIELDTRLKTGLDIIDNQHKILFDLIKDLTNAIKAGVNHKVLDTLLGVIRDYAFLHFQAEEDLLANQDTFRDHCLEHYKLIRQLNAFILDFKNNRERSLPLVSDFLNDWLILHIERYDLPSLTREAVDIPLTVNELVVDDFDTGFEEHRRHKRLASTEVVDGKILANCYNATRLKSSTVRVTNMSPGGLLLGAATGHEVSDLLIISCNIGKNFKLKEKAIVRSVQGKTCGVEFIAPAEETIHFLTNLYGSVHLNRAKNL